MGFHAVKDFNQMKVLMGFRAGNVHPMETATFLISLAKYAYKSYKTLRLEEAGIDHHLLFDVQVMLSTYRQNLNTAETLRETITEEVMAQLGTSSNDCASGLLPVALVSATLSELVTLYQLLDFALEHRKKVSESLTILIESSYYETLLSLKKDISETVMNRLAVRFPLIQDELTTRSPNQKKEGTI